MVSLCRICEARKAKRACPGVGGDICPQCCGREREETIYCPLNCVYLREARRHERPDQNQVIDFPHKEIQVEERYLEESNELFTVVSLSVIKAAQETPRIIDADIRDCLEAVVKTYLALGSGIIYESKPENMLAGAMYGRLMASIEDFKKFAFEKTGIHSVKDDDLLKIFAFLQRLEITTHNGRRYGRAFLWALSNAYGWSEAAETTAAPTEASGLIL